MEKELLNTKEPKTTRNRFRLNQSTVIINHDKYDCLLI